MKRAYHRVVCYTDHSPAMDPVVDFCWERSGLVRWTFYPFPSGPLPEEPDCDDLILHIQGDQHIESVNNIVRTWSSGIVVDNRRVWRIPGRRAWIEMTGDALHAHLTERILNKRNSVERQVPLEWANAASATVKLLRATVADEISELIVEKYFPDRSGAVVLSVVSGGLSGVPLLRANIANQGEFYLKLFRTRQEFCDEWAYHQEARKWLGADIVVALRPIPGVGESGALQIRAFPGLEGRTFFPVCYVAGLTARTLKEYYRTTAESEPVKERYGAVISALGREQATEAPVGEFLYTVPLSGPFRSHSTPRRSVVTELRSDGMLQTIRSAREFSDRHLTYALRGHRKGENVEWGPFDKFLEGHDMPWMTAEVPMILGQVHGDANSRNVLVSDQEGAPIQIVDCGCFHDQAPRVFDLAQLESDLIINLAAIENDAPGYGEIDSRLLRPWIRQQKEVLMGLTGYGIGRMMPMVLRRPYEILDVIRQEASRLSLPHDRDGRAYFFFLMYWMLRKVTLLQRGVLPHVKAIVAVHAAAEICSRFSKWRGTG